MERRSRSIILRVINYGEADRLVTFFTEDFGKLKGVAKNAKKSNRRFGGALEPGTIGEMRFVEKPNQDLMRLEEIEVDKPAWKIASSLRRIMALEVSLELADAMLPIANPSKEKFSLLERWISFLSDSEPKANLRHAFYFKWLDASGLKPVFDKCVSCNKTENGTWHVVPSQGGTICQNCYEPHMSGISVSDGGVKYLRRFDEGKVGAKYFAEADEVFEYLINSAVGRELKSLKVVRDVATSIKD